ncbi:MAG: hypothetical protein A2Y02_03110 [Omnitrophica bacterium GWA2_52_12]|nr:MAG: hypothetical protein A2Y02_03110 [Omnitrophica bacterium GWA2_52_12]
MTDVQKLQAFLECVRYAEDQHGEGPKKIGKVPFITISRETGAGGHTLASSILNEMREHTDPAFEGWHMCDQELCKMVADEPGLKVTMKNLLASEYRPVMEDFLEQLIVGVTPQDAVVKKMFEIIRQLALLGKVILVGHGGASLTRDLPGGIHLRLVASLPNRVRRMGKLLGISEARAREEVLEQDKGRAKLVKTFFNRDIHDPLLYDIVWNTDRVSVEEIARLVLQLVKVRAAESLKACKCS